MSVRVLSERNNSSVNDAVMCGPSLPRKVLYIKGSSDNEHLVRELCSAGWLVRVVSTLTEAQELIDQGGYCVGLADLDFLMRAALFKEWERIYLADPHMEWVALLSEALRNNEKLWVALRQHFFDFHTLPADKSRLLFTLGHAYGVARLPCPVSNLVGGAGSEEGGIVGQSPAVERFLCKLDKIASVDAPVLIMGESGTGKELAARMIHERSRRARERFVAMNCGAIPTTLIQSELFGYEKGAFTGADLRKIGQIESAQGGTLFLDEIGDLPHELQTNLLRFLQERTIERVGGHRSLSVDVRVIAATHVDLERAVAEGRFREDLYYRLNVIQVRAPSLRERGTDIEVLARCFFRKFSSDKSWNLRGFSESAIEAMYGHSWPGNVRELMNRVRQAMIMSENRLITPEDLGLESVANEELPSLAEARASAEKETISLALRQSAYNVSAAASKLGTSRATLYRLAGRHQLL